MERQTISMPMVALRGMTILPEMVIHFDVSRKRSVQAVQKAMQGKEQKVFLVAQRELSIEEPTQKDVYEIGTIAIIKQIADITLARKTGARGLRAIMENIMMDTMYHVPSDDTIKSCLITKEAVLGNEKPLYNSNTIATQSA